MPIGITNGQALVEPSLSVGKPDDSWRNESELACTQAAFSVPHIGRDEIGLPLEEVTCFGIRGIRASITRCDVFEKLHAGAGRSTQGRDAKTRAKHVIQMLLFDAVVFAFSDLFQSESISIE